MASTPTKQPRLMSTVLSTLRFFLRRRGAEAWAAEAAAGREAVRPEEAAAEEGAW